MQAYETNRIDNFKRQWSEQYEVHDVTSDADNEDASEGHRFEEDRIDLDHCMDIEQAIDSL